jgi:hypothetical protein
MAFEMSRTTDLIHDLPACHAGGLFAEEDRPFFTRERWFSGYRWYRAPNVVCLEDYRPLPPSRPTNQPILPAVRG